MSDDEFDRLCQLVASRWEELSEFQQWQLESFETILASGSHVKITAMVEGGALAWHKEVGKEELQGDRIKDDQWKWDEARQVRWVSADI